MNSSQISIIVVALATLWLSVFAGCTKEAENQNEPQRHAETNQKTVVSLDRRKMLQIGIHIETVQRKPMVIPLSLPGKVSFNERKLANITSRVSGRVEKVNAFVNDKVNLGSVLMEMYSQEYLTMQFEFLQAVERLNRSQESPGDEKMTARLIYKSARRKLIVAGETEEDVQKLESTKIEKPYYQVLAPFTGTILAANTQQGAFVQVGTELFHLADLTTLWVLADIYEKDLPLVKAGMKAVVEVVAYPDSFDGTISTIYGVLDEKTRTVKARIEVRNKDSRLKPEMFCTVKIQKELGKQTIKIPSSAVLGETDKHFVFIALNDTTFEKRDVRTGIETREFAEILDGLIVGEKIVVKGGFFLKSELAKETSGKEQ